MKLCMSILLAMTACVLAQKSNNNCDKICCDVTPTCNNVSTLNMNIQQFAQTSPHYELVMTKDVDTVTYQSVCSTYFQVTENLYLEFRSVNVKGGSNEISVQIVANLSPGVFRVQGVFDIDGNTTSVNNAYIVGAACPNSGSPIYLYYKCYMFRDCQFVNPKYDSVNGKSTSPTNTQACLNAFKNMVRNKGFTVDGFVQPPSDSYSCVAYFGNNTAVNYQQIAPCNRVSYPANSCS